MRSILTFLLLFPFLYSCDWIPEDLTEDGSNKIENLEVMNKDLGNMNWDDAMKEVAELGDGWRLPTKEECLKILYPNLSKILNLKDVDGYWTSEEAVSPYDNNNFDYAYYFHFGVPQLSSYFRNRKDALHYVRAVRSL